MQATELRDYLTGARGLRVEVKCLQSKTYIF
jgi:hypothetical protein